MPGDKIVIALHQPNLRLQTERDLGNDMFPLTATDFSSCILKIKEAKPDLVFCSIGGINLIDFLKQYKEFGLRGQYEISGATINQSDSWNMGIDTMVGVWPFIWYYKIKAKGSPEFTKAFWQKFAKPPENGSWQDYVALKALFAVIEKTKSLDSATLVKGLEGYRFDALKGRDCYFREWDHQLIQPIYIAEPKKKEEMEDEWDHFKILEELPAPADPLEKIAGTKEEVGCKLDSL